MVMEAYAFQTAVKESRFTKAIIPGKALSEGHAYQNCPLCLEDFGALMGLVFAFVCVLIADVTGNAVWDGIGTLSIGILLGLIAIILAIETKSLLIGKERYLNNQ